MRPNEASAQRTCPLCKDCQSHGFCARCDPEAFGAALADAMPRAAHWASMLNAAPFDKLLVCGHCGKQRARADGFCGACGMGNGAGYVSFQEVAALELSKPSNWRPKKATAHVIEAPVMRQVSLLGGNVAESNGRSRR